MAAYFGHDDVAGLCLEMQKRATHLQHQGITFSLMFSHFELTQDHVLLGEPSKKKSVFFTFSQKTEPPPPSFIIAPVSCYYGKILSPPPLWPPYRPIVFFFGRDDPPTPPPGYCALGAMIAHVRLS